MVSWEHIKIWADRGQVWCSDAGSTNGTFVNGFRISGTVQLNIGDKITVGTKLELKVQLHGLETAQPQGSRSVALEEIATGLKHPFRSTRLHHRQRSRRRPADPERAALRRRVRDPRSRRHLDDGRHRRPAARDRPGVRRGGLRFRLVEVDVPRSATIQPQRDRFPTNSSPRSTAPRARWPSSRT
jgi:pSer/pThr/pTyr-binding forkhead associated (FHA) protein